MKAILDTGIEQFLFNDLGKAAKCAALLQHAELIDYDTKRNKHIPLPESRRYGRRIKVSTVEDSQIDLDAFEKTPIGRAKHRKGFSLVDLLCVLAVVAILAALLVPAVSRAVRHARAKVNNAVQFHNDRLGYAWDGDTTSQIFSVSSYNEMTNTTEIP